MTVFIQIIFYPFMRFCYFPLFIILCVFCFKIHQIDGSSLMKRIREKQSADESKGLELPSDSWMHIPQQIQDVLASIDDKLRSLDTFSYTLKLARLDFSLEQLVRRMENIETKLGRLETKFDVRMEKVEEVVIGKDIKEEFSNEHLSRRMENLNEKINTKAAFLDAKIDVKMERVNSKLDLLERDLHNSVDDILEKLIKNDERHAQFESELMKSVNKIDEFIVNVSDLRLFLKEEFLNLFQKRMDKIELQISNMADNVEKKFDHSSRQIVDLSNNIKNSDDSISSYLQDTKVKIENISTTCNSDLRPRSITDCENDISTMQSNSKEQLDNLTATIDKAVKMGENKFNELDSDLELYTRKVINSIQELWKTSDQMKTFLSNTLEQGNKTREIVRQEFRRLHEQIEPLPKIEPKLSHISEDLDKKVSELSATVDNSFATLLVAQNTFIASCRRIQQEEMHIYDILQQIVFEMRNRSISDIKQISSELQIRSTEIHKTLANVLNAIFLVGNTTFTEIKNMNQKRSKQKCIFIEDNLKWNDINSLCNHANSIDLTEVNDEQDSDIHEELYNEPDRFDETQLIRNNLVENISDTELPKSKTVNSTMMSDYENDYPITDGDYIDQETE